MENGKVRMVLFELSGSDDTVREAVRAFQTVMATKGAPSQVVAVQTAERGPSRLSPAGRKLLRAPKPKAASSPAPEPPPEPARPATLSDWVRRAIEDGPKTDGEIRAWVVERGCSADSKQVYQALWAMRKRNEIWKGDADGKWRVAEAPRK